MATKLTAYADVWGLTLDGLWMQVAAVALAVFEFLLGVYLFLGVRRSFTARALTLFTAAMTGLTLWIYLADPVPDCGCFGAAVTISHGWTLAKNVVLLAFCIGLEVYDEPWRVKFMTERHAWLTCIYCFIYAVSVSLYALHYLPPLDFSPYKVGTDLRAALLGEGEASADDQPVNFYVYDPETLDDLSLEIVETPGQTFLLSVPHPATADDGISDRLNDLYDYCADRHIPFYLVAAADKEVPLWRERTGAAYPDLRAEDTELHTMVRADLGLLLLTDGRITAKWSGNNLPSLSEKELDDPSAVHDFTPAPRRLSPLTRLLLILLAPIAFFILAENAYLALKLRRRWQTNSD